MSLIMTFNFGGWSLTAGPAGLNFGARGNPTISCSKPLQQCTSTSTSGNWRSLAVDVSVDFFFCKLRQIVKSTDCKMLDWLSGSQTTKTNSRLCSLVTKSTNFSGNRVNYFPSHSPFHISLVEPAWLRYKIEKGLRAV